MELSRLQQEGVLIYNKSCRTLRLYDEILLRNQPTLPNTISSSYLHSFPLKLKVVIFTKPLYLLCFVFFLVYFVEEMRAVVPLTGCMSLAETISCPSLQYHWIDYFIGQRILSQTSFTHWGSEKSYCITEIPTCLPASLAAAKIKLSW